MKNTHDDQADVVLILEGTYPFVMGGVSSWVHRLVCEMPELDFGIVHIAPKVDYYGDAPAYEMPANVVFLEQVGLLPHRPPPRRRPRKRQKQVAELWSELLGGINELSIVVSKQEATRSEWVGRWNNATADE